MLTLHEQELVSSLQPVFLNHLAVQANSRQAVFKLMSAYTNLFGVPETDRSFPQVCAINEQLNSICGQFMWRRLSQTVFFAC